MLGTLASIWGVAVGVGVAIDYFFIRTSARVKTHRSLRYFWIKVRRGSVPDLPIFVANGAIRVFSNRIILKNLSKKSQIIFSRFQAVLYLVFASFILTSFAFYAREVITLWREPNKEIELSIIEVLQISFYETFELLSDTSITPFGVSLHIFFLGLYITNFMFDIMTIFITLHILKAIVRNKKDIYRLLLIFLDFFFALLLFFSVAELSDNVANYLWSGMFSITWEYFYENNVIQILEAGRWIFTNYGQPNSVADFFYSSTTLIPTTVFLLFLLISIIAKPVAHLGQWLMIHVLGVTMERSPELLPVGAMLGALVAFVTTIFVALSAAISLLASVIAG